MVRHVRVRKDQEALVADRLDDLAGHVLGLEQASRQQRRGADRILERAVEHRGADRLRAQAGDLDAGIADR